MTDQIPELSWEELRRKYSDPAEAEGEADSREGRSPFKFLDSYEVNDADIFFGRDSEIDELLSHFHSYGHVLIYGESGSGKSSLVGCGLRSRIPEADALFIPLRVHASALPTLCHQICESASREPGVSIDIGLDAGLIETLKAVREAASRPLVLFFDQFEELFIFHDAEIRQHFAGQLASIHARKLNIKIIIGIRQDYLAHLSEMEGLVEGLFDNRFWLRRMSREKAADAVVKACNAGNVAIDADVARTIIHRLDPNGQGVELPYLQVAMDRMYRQALAAHPDEPVITANDVLQLGDIARILGAFLVEEVAKLSSPDTGRQILKALVTREGTRRSLDKETLAHEAAGFGETIAADALDEHLRELCGVRILRIVADTQTFELRHDALAATVATWISEVEKELLEVRDNLLNRFREYQARGEPDTALLDQAFLDYLAVYRERLTPLLSPQLQQYVHDSQRHVGQARRFRRRVLQIVTASVSLVIVGCLVMALWQWNAAAQREEEANANLITAKQQRERADRNSAKADQRAKEATEAQAEAERQAAINHRSLYYAQMNSAGLTFESNGAIGLIRANLRNWLPVEGDPDLRGWEWYFFFGQTHRATHELSMQSGGYCIDWTPDGSQIAIGCMHHILILDAGISEPRYLHGHKNIVHDVRWDHAGKRLASADRDGVVIVWDDPLTAPAGKHLPSRNGVLKTLSWSHDDKLLAAAVEAKPAVVWQTDNWQAPVELLGLGITQVSFNPKDNRLACGKAMSITVLNLDDISDIREEHTFDGHRGYLHCVTWDPAGEKLASGSDDGEIRIWDVQRKALSGQLQGHTELVDRLSWAEDGRLASASWDYTIRIWDPETQQQTDKLHGHTDRVYSAKWDPTGTRIVSTGPDGALKFWDPNVKSVREAPAYTTRALVPDRFSIAWNPVKRALATSIGNELRLWDVDSMECTGLYDGDEVGWNSDGTLLVSHLEHDVVVRDVRTDTMIGKVQITHNGSPLRVDRTAWNPQRNSVAIAGHLELGQAAVYEWVPGSQNAPRLLREFFHHPMSIAWSDDGRRLAVGTHYNHVYVWDQDHPGEPIDIELPDGPYAVHGLDWHERKRQLAIGCADHQIRIRDMDTGDLRSLSGHNFRVSSVSWSRTHDRLLSSSGDMTIKVWDTLSAKPATTLLLDSKVGAATWSPDGQQIAAVTSSGMLRIWDASRGHEAARRELNSEHPQ